MDADCSRSCRLRVLIEPPQMVVDVFARYGMEFPHLILELLTSIWALQVGFVDLESNRLKLRALAVGCQSARMAMVLGCDVP